MDLEIDEKTNNKTSDKVRLHISLVFGGVRTYIALCGVRSKRILSTEGLIPSSGTPCQECIWKAQQMGMREVGGRWLPPGQ